MSIDSIHIILDLILKSWAGTLAQPEEERLNELLEDPEWAQLKQDLEDDRFIMGRFKEYEKYDKIVDFSQRFLGGRERYFFERFLFGHRWFLLAG